MLISYIVIDFSKTLESKLEAYPLSNDFFCVGMCSDYLSSLHLLLDKKPHLVFFCFTENIPLSLLLDLQQYVENLPYVIAISSKVEDAYLAIKYGVDDFVLTPLDSYELRKSLLKFSRHSKKESTGKLCVKSNGDHYFISFDDIVCIKADNNTTDFYLCSGKIITGFRTMKFFENQLPNNFYRIHNSYIVNISFVNRINLGKFQCYLLDNTHVLPFSRTFKDNIESIIKAVG